MPKLNISPYPDTPEARAELVKFLNRQLPSPGAPSWEQRMRHWWDENPAAASDPERGRWVHAEGQLVAYGGSIPALCTLQGRTFQTLNATTFCVDHHHPRAAAQIFLYQRELVAQRMITHTTPSPRVQEALLKLGAHAERQVTRYFFPAGFASHLRGRFWWPSLPAHLRVITDPAEVISIARPYQNAERIEKWITPEYLRWYCRSKMRQHHFLGLVDSSGMLSSYLIVTPRKVRGLQSWDVLETFTTCENGSDLQALTGLLVKEPGILPGGAMLVTGSKFSSDHSWDHAPAFFRRTQHVCHFFLLPKLMRHVPKHTVMAEGDLGL